MGWEDVAFVHWPVPPRSVAAFLPAGVRPDVFDGVTYIGLVAFRITRTAPGVGVPLPYLGTFCETNIRLYGVDDEGRRSVVFLSMDAERLLPVLVAQAGLRLPYVWSSMGLTREGDVLRYRTRRRTGTATSRLALRVGEPIAEPSPLEHFLTARWGLHVDTYGRTLFLPGRHPRWPLHRAQLLTLQDDLVAATGLPAPQGPPLVHYSPGVRAEFGLPRQVRPPG